jgi:hypothetical protein
VQAHYSLTGRVLMQGIEISLILDFIDLSPKETIFSDF